MMGYTARMGTGHCPCKGCEIRTEACHGTCEAYAGWKKEKDEVRCAYLKKNKARYEASSHYREAISKAVARKHRQRKI